MDSFWFYCETFNLPLTKLCFCRVFLALLFVGASFSKLLWWKFVVRALDEKRWEKSSGFISSVQGQGTSETGLTDVLDICKHVSGLLEYHVPLKRSIAPFDCRKKEAEWSLIQRKGMLKAMDMGGSLQMQNTGAKHTVWYSLILDYLCQCHFLPGMRHSSLETQPWNCIFTSLEARDAWQEHWQMSELQIHANL